jgi:hypothetical protein
MLKALSSVSNRSMFVLSPFRNLSLVISVVCSLALHVLILYNKRIASLFGVTALTGRHWKVVAAFALPLLVIEEVLKFVDAQVAAARNEDSSRDSESDPLKRDSVAPTVNIF